MHEHAVEVKVGNSLAWHLHDYKYIKQLFGNADQGRGDHSYGGSRNENVMKIKWE